MSLVFATNCGIPSYKQTATSAMSRSRHIARSSVTSLNVAFANWLVNWSASDLTESGPGASMTLSAAIEYNGVNYPVTWSSSGSVTISDGTTSALSDAVSVTIPAGEAFFVRSYHQITGNIVLSGTGTGVIAAVSGADSTNGEQLRTGGATEVSGTGSLANGSLATGLCYRPVLLTSSTATKAWLLLGDSRQQGYLDAYTGTSGDKGQFARLVGPYWGYCNCGVPGDGASDFVLSHANRVALAPYFTHVVCEYGINDVLKARTEAQIRADLTSIAGYFSLPVYQCTTTPITNSTDSWATTANQTPYAENTVRLALNDDIRSGIPGMAGYFEIADVVESSRNSGKWAVNGSANYFTSEGVHEVNTANISLLSARDRVRLVVSQPVKRRLSNQRRSRLQPYGYR